MAIGMPYIGWDVTIVPIIILLFMPFFSPSVRIHQLSIVIDDKFPGKHLFAPLF